MKNDCWASGFVCAIIYSCVKIFWHGPFISEPLEAVACIKNITKTSHLNTHTYRKPYPGDSDSSKSTRPAACDSALGSWGWEPRHNLLCLPLKHTRGLAGSRVMAPRVEKSPPSVKTHSCGLGSSPTLSPAPPGVKITATVNAIGLGKSEKLEYGGEKRGVGKTADFLGFCRAFSHNSNLLSL